MVVRYEHASEERDALLAHALNRLRAQAVDATASANA